MGILFLGLASQQAKAGELFYSNLIIHAKNLDEFWLKAAFLFIFAGYAAKVGLFPMYTAGIDAKDKAPSPASAIFSSALMNVGFISIFRMYGITARTNIHQWASSILIISSLLSLIIAAAYMLRVRSFKRMFAYSSVEHMSIAVVGLSMGTLGIFGSILHIIFHSFTKAGLFYQYGSVNRVIKSKFISDAGEYFENNTSGALVLLLGFFMVIIWALGENIFRLLFYHPPLHKDNSEVIEKISVWESVPQFALMAGVIYLGLNPPDPLIELINQAVKSFG
jgi:hydrogenase-4 component F